MKSGNLCLLVMVVSSAAVVALLGGSGCTSVPEAQEPRREVIHWLDKAERAAASIEAAPGETHPEDPREHALMMVAGTCIELGEYERARAIAAKLPESQADSALYAIPVGLARKGEFDRAVREADSMGMPSSLALVAIIAAETDVPKALSIAEKVPEESRDYVRQSIVRDQVLAGNLTTAARIAGTISDEESKQEADQWLAAGRLAERGGDLAQAAATANVDLSELGGRLCRILESAAESGDVEKARRILPVLATHDQRARGWTAFAAHALKSGRTDEFRRCIGKALDEVGAIDDPHMAPFLRATRYTLIAQLQADSGDFDAAAKTIRLADESGREEAERGLGVFQGLGGHAVLISLLVKAGKTDEALKMAKAGDVPLTPLVFPVLAEALVTDGRQQEAEELLNARGAADLEYLLYLAAAEAAAQKEQAECPISP